MNDFAMQEIKKTYTVPCAVVVSETAIDSFENSFNAKMTEVAALAKGTASIQTHLDFSEGKINAVIIYQKDIEI